MGWKRIGSTVELRQCPFCGGKDTFFQENGSQLMIVHLPPAGVCCPARMEQVCDSKEQGRGWWNQGEVIDEKWQDQ